MPSRRKFLQSSMLALSAPAALSFPLKAFSATSATGKTAPATDRLNLGIAGYTFENYTIDQSIAIMQRVGVTDLSIKDFHLPLDSTPEKIAEVKEKFKAGGLNIYAVGVIYMTTQAEVDRAFDYAARVGVNLLVGVPTYDLLKYTEQKVISSGIKIAIHNHGPEDKRYPSPKDVYDRIKDLHPNMGLCIDIGHAQRAGTTPAVAVKDYAARVFDLHIKDVTAAQANGKAIEVGRGVIDFPALIKTLHKIGYQGRCSIEFEKDMHDSLPGIAESVGFFRGVDKAV